MKRASAKVINQQPADISGPRISIMAQILIVQLGIIERLEAELKEAEAAARRTAEIDLPELMRELGVEAIKLADGTKVDLVKDIFASIPKDRYSEACDWLRSNNLEGVIKTRVLCEFDRGANDEALKVASMLHEQFGIAATVDENVHPSTLKSLMKEQIEAAAPIPFDLFGIREVRRAKVTKPKV